MNLDDVLHINNEVFFSHKKEGNNAMFTWMNPEIIVSEIS